MSSKIKVDTIENVAGSGNVSLGSGHNLVVPGNITGQGTAAITSNATVGGTLGVTGASTLTGDLQMGANTAVSSSRIVSVIEGGNSLEWGHANAAGYRSTLGAFSGGGQPFIAFSAEHGTNANTFRTRGLKGHAMGTFDNAGGMTFKAIQTASGDNLTNVDTMKIDNDGNITKPRNPSFLANLNSDVAMDVGVISFGTVVHNTGTHYNNSNYRFTAPVTGRYYLSYSMRANHGTSGHLIHPSFYINGSSDSASRTIYKNDTSAQYMAVTFSYVRQLNANDYVEVRTTGGSSGGTLQNGQCIFSGHLIG